MDTMRANLIAFKDKVGQGGSPSPLEPANSDSDDWIGVGPTPLPRGRRLDVDAVLARSLPKTVVNRDEPRTKSLAN